VARKKIASCSGGKKGGNKTELLPVQIHHGVASAYSLPFRGQNSLKIRGEMNIYK
jgi:hypothetical protein